MMEEHFEDDGKKEEQITLPRDIVVFICQTMEYVLQVQDNLHPITEGYIRDAVRDLRKKLECDPRG